MSLGLGHPDGLRMMHDGFPGCPDFIPWDRITDEHEKRAHENHGQTLRGMNERGGASPLEFRAIALGKGWRELYGDGYRGNGIGFDQYYEAANFVREFIGQEPLPPATNPEFETWRRKKRL